MKPHQHSLNATAFAALLASLDPDLHEAAQRYERLREKLIRLFTWRGCADAPELADETINRVATRVAEDSAVGRRVEQFSVGVAHRIYLEVLRAQKRERQVNDELRARPADLFAREATDPELLRLEHCISELGRADQELILGYYSDRGAGVMANRKALQARLGISPGSLRIKVYRLRSQLEARLAAQRGAGEVSDDG